MKATKNDLLQRTDFQDRYDNQAEQAGTRKLDRNFIKKKKAEYIKNREEGLTVIKDRSFAPSIEDGIEEYHDFNISDDFYESDDFN